MRIIEKIKENYSVEVLFFAVVCFLAGIVIGLLVSPVKNGIAIGSYNGCNNKITDSNKTKKIKEDK